VGTALTEAQALWRSEHSEHQADQRDQLRQLEELAESVRYSAARLEQAERTLGSQEKGLRRTEEQLEALAKREWSLQETPPWFAELESAINSLDVRLNEQQVVTEVQLAKLQVDAETLRRKDVLGTELMQEVEARLGQELDKLEARMLGGSSGGYFSVGEGRSLARRLDEVEAKAAASRVRVDSHDTRFTSLAERSEVVCQQAADGARQVCQQSRDEILGDVDCQLRVMRQRIETLSQLCEELMLRQASADGGLGLGASLGNTPSASPVDHRHSRLAEASSMRS